MAIRSGRFAIDINNPEFRQFRDGSGERIYRNRIDIVPPLPTGVSISAAAAIAHLDIDHSRNARLFVAAESVTHQGFDVVISTWADTRIYGVSVSWVAHTIE